MRRYHSMHIWQKFIPSSCKQLLYVTQKGKQLGKPRSKDLNWHFTKRGKYPKIHSICKDHSASLVTQGKPSKALVRYHCTANRMAGNKKCWWGCRVAVAFICCEEEHKLVQVLSKLFFSYLVEIKICLSMIQKFLCRPISKRNEHICLYKYGICCITQNWR